MSITEPTGSDYLCPEYGQLNVAILMSRRQQLVLSPSLSLRAIIISFAWRLFFSGQPLVRLVNGQRNGIEMKELKERCITK